MAVYNGKNGVIKVGAQAVGEVTNFSLELTAETIESTTMGMDYRSYIPSYINWTGTVDVYWDPDDAGQTAFVVGSQVTVNLYPEGDTTGDTEYSGTAIVTGFTRTAAFDGLVTASITFQGTGELSVNVV